MAIGMGGTFAQDAKKIGMGFGEMDALKQKLNFPGTKGVRPYDFKGKEYQVEYVKGGGDTTLFSIKPL